MANNPVNNFPARAPVLTDVIGIQDSAGSTATAKSTFQQVVDLTIANAGFTQDSVLFAGASGEITENNAELSWDNATTTMKFGDNHTITGAVSDGFMAGNLHTLNADNASVLFGQGSQSITGFRNFATGSSHLLTTCSDSAVIGSTSATFTSASNSAAIASSVVSNTGFDNVAFVGASASVSNADDGILMGSQVTQVATHSNVMMWGDSTVGVFSSVASDKIHFRASKGLVLSDTNTVSHEASAIMDLTSSTKGFLPPRMTQTERNAIGSPAEGLFLYNETTNKTNYYNGSIWVEGDDIPTFTQGSVVFADSSGDLAQDNANFFWNDTNDSLGIGTASPSAKAKLDVASTTQGVIFCPMTEAQRDAIVAPDNGLMIYNLSSGQYNFYDGSAWLDFDNSETGTHNTDWVGPWGVTEPTGNIEYILHDGWVTLEIPQVLVNATAVASASNLTNLPASISPSSDIIMSGPRCIDNASAAFGTISITTGGLIAIGIGPAQGAYSGISTGGTSGWNRFTVRYKI